MLFIFGSLYVKYEKKKSHPVDSAGNPLPVSDKQKKINAVIDEINRKKGRTK